MSFVNRFDIFRTGKDLSPLAPMHERLTEERTISKGYWQVFDQNIPQNDVEITTSTTPFLNIVPCIGGALLSLVVSVGACALGVLLLFPAIFDRDCREVMKNCFIISGTELARAVSYVVDLVYLYLTIIVGAVVVGVLAAIVLGVVAAVIGLVVAVIVTVVQLCLVAGVAYAFFSGVEALADGVARSIRDEREISVIE